MKDGKVGSEQACCCTPPPPPPPCDCDCYEVAVNGKFGFNPDNYSDPNNEGWASGFVYNCGSGGASYTKLDYPVRMGGIGIIIDGAQAVVRQDGDSGCAGGGYEWPNATLTLGEDGCPTGIDLGEPVFSCNPVGDFACDPMYGDWGGTPEERCQKFRDFLDAHPPEFNFRPCEPACEPGYECIGTADCTLFGYCEQVDGEWMWSGEGGGGGVIPCPECPDGWTTFMNEGPAPWDPEVTLRFYQCITSKPADYATCCSPDAPRFENGNLSECETDAQFQQDTTEDGVVYSPCNWGYGCAEILLP